MSFRAALARMLVTCHETLRASASLSGLIAKDHALLCNHQFDWMILCVEDWQMFTAEYRECMHSRDLLARVGR